MLNMSKQFYNYLSKKLLDFFKNNLKIGEKFYVQIDDDNQVNDFYNYLKDTASLNGFAINKFSYTHKLGKDTFTTYYISINGVKLVIANSYKVTPDFLVTLRNQVTEQKDVWENSALLVLCNDAIDSIYNGMSNLMKKGSAFDVVSISNNLEKDIEESNLSKAEKEIIKFHLNNINENTFKASLWDYKEVFEALNSGTVTTDNYKEWGLFPDDSNLDNYSPKNIRERLEKNYKIHEIVANAKEDNNPESKLKKKFDEKGVNKLKKDDWKNIQYSVVCESYDNFKRSDNTLEYKGSSLNNCDLEYWERSKKESKAELRKRHIIIFNTTGVNEISLNFKFNEYLDEKFISKKCTKFVSVHRKSLNTTFNVNSNNITIKKVIYTHKGKTKNKYTFNILVIPCNSDVLKSIKSRYFISGSGKNTKISIIVDSDDNPIIFGSGNKKKIIPENNRNIPLDLGTELIIDEKSGQWEDELEFNLIYNGIIIPFLLKEEVARSFPVSSTKIWQEKRENHENFEFNGVKLIRGEIAHNIKDSFKRYLYLEKELIKNEIIFSELHVNDHLEKLDISINDKLKEAYVNILKYFKKENNIPSLVYLNDELKDLFTTFINLYNEEIESINEGEIIANDPNKKDLINIGVIKTENEIYLSPLSPLNIAYQLEISHQCTDEELGDNIPLKLSPKNLVPYWYGEHNELYKPIHQKQIDAHEWTIYKKNEDVSIGTANLFMEELVYDKITQFVSHFKYLFSRSNAPIKLNIINIKNDIEVIKGIFNFVRSRLSDKSNEGIIPVVINIYSNSKTSSIDTLFECTTAEDMKNKYGIDLKSNELDDLDIVRLIQNNIVYYKHKYNNAEDYEYAHISFFNSGHSEKIADNKMNQIETGLSLGGLISSVPAKKDGSDYRIGFGTKNLPKHNSLIKTAINLNVLCRNQEKNGDIAYSKDNVIITKSFEIGKDVMDNLYRNSHWVTFINPDFDLEYFENSEKLVIIHYSDQYTSSSQYDTITVTNKSKQYAEVIREFLKKSDLTITDDKLHSLIKMFNCINGEWLLRTIINHEDYDNKERLSIISAVKFLLAILDHPDISWIPISMDEVLRISGNVGLSQNGGLFSYGLKEKGDHNEDILLIGVREMSDNSIKLYYYPIEVIEHNSSSIIEKGKKQLKNIFNDIFSNVEKSSDSQFRNKFFRNFFIQLLLANEQKLYLNNIWDEKQLCKINALKDKLLNDKYDVSFGLKNELGIGSLVSFKKNVSNITYYKDDEDILIIEFPKDFAYSGLIDSIEEIHEKFINGKTDIHPNKLLYYKNLDDIDNQHYSDPESTNNTSSDEDYPEDTDNPSDDENDSPEEVTLNDVRAYIGNSINGNELFWEFGHPSLSNRHMLVQGMSGQGKTYFIQRMILELSKQNIPVVIIDYTSGFRKDMLEKEFKQELGSNLNQHLVAIDKFPLNPFTPNKIELDEGIIYEEESTDIASRFKDTINAVYKLGPQQSNVLYESVIYGVNNYGPDFDLIKLKEILSRNDSKPAESLLDRLNELLDKNPFKLGDFNWDVLDNSGEVTIIQLAGYKKEIQQIITELILWDLWNYKIQQGNVNNPFAVVLDEIQNLDFSDRSPCKKILTEGRKYGWAGIFATQSLKSFKIGAKSDLNNCAEKIFFRPTDDSLDEVANSISKKDKSTWHTELENLKKGKCIAFGASVQNGTLNPMRPTVVNVASFEEMKTKIEKDNTIN